MLDVHQLQVFMVAAELLNFSQAAKKLHMSQPSVTQHVRCLEERFQKPLFVRFRNHLTLTDAGATLLPLAAEMVQLSIRTEEIIQSLDGDICGHLILACTTTPGKYILAPRIANFLKLHPQVSATVKVMGRGEAMRQLLSGRVNLAVTSVIEYSPEIDFCKLLTDEIHLTVSASHPWAMKGQISVDELLEERFIMREETSGNYACVRAALATIGVNIDSLNRILTLGNSEAIAFAIMEGVGVGFVSNMIFRNMKEGRMVQVKVENLQIHQDVTLLQSQRQRASSAQIAFWQYISELEQPGNGSSAKA